MYVCTYAAGHGCRTVALTPGLTGTDAFPPIFWTLPSSLMTRFFPFAPGSPPTQCKLIDSMLTTQCAVVHARTHTHTHTHTRKHTHRYTHDVTWCCTVGTIPGSHRTNFCSQPAAIKGINCNHTLTHLWGHTDGTPFSHWADRGSEDSGRAAPWQHHPLPSTCLHHQTHHWGGTA